MFLFPSWCNENRKEKKRKPSTFLAEGTYARVHGPFTSAELGKKFLHWTSTPLVPALPSSHLYVIKLYRPDTNSFSRPDIRWVYERVLALQREMKTRRIVVPWVIDETRGGLRVEIQEYGGREFTTVLYNSTWKWTDDMVWTLWTSIVEILRVGMDLIEHHQLFLMDIKPENMVYTSEHGLVLIDVEYMMLETVYQRKTENVVFTLDPACVPPLFFRIFPPSYVSTPPWWEKHTPWTRPLVRRIAIFCLFYPFAMLWKTFFHEMNRSSRVRFRMNKIMDHVLQQGTDILPHVLLDMMSRVRLVDFPILWKEYATGVLRSPEDVRAVWISNENLVFPSRKMEKHEVWENYC
jgi:hypothetical protein